MAMESFMTDINIYRICLGRAHVLHIREQSTFTRSNVPYDCVKWPISTILHLGPYAPP